MNPGWFIAILVGIVGLACLLRGIWEPTRLEVTHVVLPGCQPLSGVQAAAEPADVLRVVLLTDLHMDRMRIPKARLLAALEPDIMPVDGQNLQQAMQLARDMISSLPRDSTQVLLVTSGLEESQQKVLAQYARELGPQLAILGVGTASGAPVPLAAGGFMRDAQGRILLPRLNARQLADIARQHAGRYHGITLGDRDLNYLLRPTREASSSGSAEHTQLIEQGHWLVLLLLPLAALGARRGWLGLWLCAALLPQPASAMEWADLWQRPDQQGQQLLQEQQPAAAAARFADPLWRAWALYQAGQYLEAAEVWEALAEMHPEQAEYHFNRGTAYAMAGDYQQALEAYEQTLTRVPDYHAARHNRDLIEALLATLQDQQAAAEAKAQTDATTETQTADSAGNTASNGASSTQQTAASQDATESTQGTPAAAVNGTDPATTDTQSGSPSLTSEAAESSPANGSAGSNSTASAQSQNTGHEAGIEQKQALEQWLRNIPDDPAELLRRKFLFQHLQQKETQR